MAAMTLMDAARDGKIPEIIHQAAQHEGVPAETLRDRVARGTVVVPRNKLRSFPPRAIGEGLSTKVNANIGTSARHCEVAEEMAKLDAALEAGADAVMDLSTGGDLAAIRKMVIARSPVMVGTVPIYDAAVAADRDGRRPEEIEPEDLFSAIEAHLAAGVDFLTVHCGVTLRVVDLLDAAPRVTGIVSRGGSLLALWMRARGEENPLLTGYDRLLAMAREYDACLSLGDGLRPGCLADAGDAPQVEELVTLGVLAERARKAGVQVMIEGPGHVPLDQVATQMAMQKRLCGGAPFYVLGPLVTDIAPGYDHITSAIGGAIAAASGADFLCYVTSAEHLRLPKVEEVREGVMAARIAAHAGDIAKGVAGARQRDEAFSRMRAALDWEGMFAGAIDPVRARCFREESESRGEEVCTMCGELCAIKLGRQREELA
jgi:phosphomethylpyrimidine synthase